MRILLVEDEVPLAEMVRRGLVAEGHSVQVTHDGISGLAAAGTGRHDVVVLDIMIPGLSGYRVLERLRPAGNWTPMLMLTAKDVQFDGADGFGLVADHAEANPIESCRRPLVQMFERNAVARRHSGQQPLELAVPSQRHVRRPIHVYRHGRYCRLR